eukprot:TRINITY_DN1623_c0_g1_i1.p1 TRINITY_DN1623_c0_g1~~TRINITY_DN1623_c0_g1_i1.p1  ORF type:complete len:614 (+),score=162.97 TRINITY_DN1623_c0_g1_i1:125-1966(+)
MADLKSLTKQRIVSMVQSVGNSDQWKVMIVDHDTMRILSAACRMFEIMDQGVTLIELITKERERVPSLPAIYFLTPTVSSIDGLLSDFSQNPKYASAHLFFTAKLSPELLGKIKGSKNLVSRVKTLKEFNLDFLAYEQQIFHFDSPNSFYSFFSPDSNDGPKEQRRIADKIVSVCASLKECPIVRYQANTPIAPSLSGIVQDKLDQLLKSSDDFARAAKENSGNRSTLLILDRSHDVMSCLLHEFTYQAMIYDLLPIDKDRFKFNTTTNDGNSKEREVLLSESDPLWPSLRHQHIADTMNAIMGGFNDFMKENKVTKLKSGEVSSLKEMSEAMRSMPQYKETLDKYSLHINLASAAMKVFEDTKLKPIGFTEQDMATGEDASGAPAKNILSTLPTLFNDEIISQQDKLRLLMIYIVSQEGIKETDRNRLVSMAKVGEHQQACLSNLRFLGISTTRGAKKSGKSSEKKKKNKMNEDAPPYELSRYVPNIKSIGEQLVHGNLDLKEFPAVKEVVDLPKSSATDKTPTSLRKSLRPTWSDKEQKNSKKNIERSGSRVIIFIAGGMTMSEMRSVYELSSKHHRDVILGSTNIIQPKEFMEEMIKLKPAETKEVDLPK